MAGCGSAAAGGVLDAWSFRREVAARHTASGAGVVHGSRQGHRGNRCGHPGVRIGLCFCQAGIFSRTDAVVVVGRQRDGGQDGDDRDDDHQFDQGEALLLVHG